MGLLDTTARQPCGKTAIGRLGGIAGLLATALTLALAAPLASAQEVASFGNVKISAAEVKLIAGLQPQIRQQILSSEQNLEILLRQMLTQRAVVEEAQAKGWDKRPEIMELVENARHNVIASTYLASASPLPPGYPSDAEVEAAYEQNKARLFTPSSYHLAQIFVRRPADPGKVEASAKHAAELAQKAGSADADFAAIARAESEDEASKAKGGDTGWSFEPSLLPELRGPVQRMKPGEVSAPVPSQQGWHIVKLLESRQPAPASLEDARAAIVNELRVRKLAELRRDYVDALLKKSTIKLDQDAIAKLRAELQK